MNWPLNNAGQLDVSKRKSLLRVCSVQSLVVVRLNLQQEWLRSRNDNIIVQQTITTKSVIARSNAIETALVDADEIVLRTESTSSTAWEEKIVRTVQKRGRKISYRDEFGCLRVLKGNQALVGWLLGTRLLPSNGAPKLNELWTSVSHLMAQKFSSTRTQAVYLRLDKYRAFPSICCGW